MATVVCLRHFETAVDPETPPSVWELSAAGQVAEATFLERGFVRSVGTVYTSPEPKACGTAERVATRADAPLRVEETLAEVDRSGKGFVDRDEYVSMVERYFRAPETPFDWEDRRDVEDRVRRFVTGLDAEDGPVLVVSHGMLLATMLAPVLERDSLEFWEALSFGEVMEFDAGELWRQWS